MKEYFVVLKSDPTKHLYSVDAPSRRIARWCTLNMFQNEYCSSALKVNDFKAYPAKWKAISNIKEMEI